MFIEDTATGRIRFTRKGIETYGTRFACAGYDIRRIHTPAAFRVASDASFEHDMRRLAATARGEDPLLDSILAGLPGWDD